jgi:PAS domain S-box-containing protein
VGNIKKSYTALDGDIMSVSADGTPCIIVSGEGDRLGTITHCNMSAVRIFGYQPHEMKGQRVEKLMPDLYGRNHKRMLENAI